MSGKSELMRMLIEADMARKAPEGMNGVVAHIVALDEMVDMISDHLANADRAPTIVIDSYPTGPLPDAGPEILVVGGAGVSTAHLEAMQAVVDRGAGVGVCFFDLEMAPDEFAARLGQKHERVSHPPLPPEPVEIELKPLYDPVLFDRPAPTHPTSPRASWRRRR